MGRFDEKFGPPPPLVPPHLLLVLTALVCGCLLVLIRPPFVVQDNECSGVRVTVVSLLCAALAWLPGACGKSSNQLVQEAVSYLAVR